MCSRSFPRTDLIAADSAVTDVQYRLVESELHDRTYFHRCSVVCYSVILAEGTSEALSKIWMPLDEYTKVTMEGLRAGDPYISASASLDAFNKFDRAKWDATLAIMKGRERWE